MQSTPRGAPKGHAVAEAGTTARLLGRWAGGGPETNQPPQATLHEREADRDREAVDEEEGSCPPRVASRAKCGPLSRSLRDLQSRIVSYADASFGGGPTTRGGCTATHESSPATEPSSIP